MLSGIITSKKERISTFSTLHHVFQTTRDFIIQCDLEGPIAEQLFRSFDISVELQVKVYTLHPVSTLRHMRLIGL